jgi:hypothetical protein
MIQMDEIRKRYPVCKICDDAIIYVPASGFGREGEWRHYEPPRAGVADHTPTPKVIITPPPKETP